MTNLETFNLDTEKKEGLEGITADTLIDSRMRGFLVHMVEKNNNENFYTVKAITVFKGYVKGRITEEQLFNELGTTKTDYERYLNNLKEKQYQI